MKICPTCNRTFEDTLRFCLEDGATLVRVDQSPTPTMTMPVDAAFRPPPAPTLQVPAQPSKSTLKTLAGVFFSPGRAFESFRDVETFGPAAARFLIAAVIIIGAVIAFNALYLVRIGPERIARASIEASPNITNLSGDQKDRAVQMQSNPSFMAFTLAIRFGGIVFFQLVSFFLGAALYLLGTMATGGKIKYFQSVLVWTYAALPPTVIWVVVNSVALLVAPPSTDVAIALGSAGVVHANLGALVTVTTLPVPVLAVALGAFDLFEFYGLLLAILGLGKVARLSWIKSFGIVVFVWLLGVGWRVGTAGVIAALFK